MLFLTRVIHVINFEKKKIKYYCNIISQIIIKYTPSIAMQREENRKMAFNNSQFNYAIKPTLG